MDDAHTSSQSSRRRLLKIGAVAAPAVLTLKPSQAWAASSTCNVEIPFIVTQPGGGEPYTFLPLGTQPDPSVPADQIIPPPPSGFYTATEITNHVPNTAQLAYLRNLLATGGPGMSCLQSINFIG